MKADIESQIELISEQIAFPEIFKFNTEEVNQLRTRKRFLSQILITPFHKIDQKVLNFVHPE